VNQTASRLQASGDNVILNKVGNAPLDQCTVSAVRPGHTHSRTYHGVPGGALTTTVISKRSTSTSSADTHRQTITPFCAASISARHIRCLGSYILATSGFPNGACSLGNSAFENFDAARHALPSVSNAKSIGQQLTP